MDLDDLVAAAQAGDARALDELLLRLYGAIRPCFGRELNQADIDDLVQTTLMVVVHKLPQFEFLPGKPFIRWAQGIARIEVRNHRRDRQRRQRVEGRAGEIRLPSTKNLSSRIDRAANLELVAEAIAELESPLRRVVENDLDEGDIDELAKREGIKVGSVRGRRMRAHRKVRGFIRRRRKIPGQRTPTPKA